MHWSQKVKELKKLVTDSILIMLQYVKIVVELLLRQLCKGHIGSNRQLKMVIMLILGKFLLKL